MENRIREKLEPTGDLISQPPDSPQKLVFNHMKSPDVDSEVARYLKNIEVNQLGLQVAVFSAPSNHEKN